MVTRRSALGYGSGLKRTASTIEKTAVSAAMPHARITTARRLNPGRRNKERSACFHLVIDTCIGVGAGFMPARQNGVRLLRRGPAPIGALDRLKSAPTLIYRPSWTIQ